MAEASVFPVATFVPPTDATAHHLRLQNMMRWCIQNLVWQALVCVHAYLSFSTLDKPARTGVMRRGILTSDANEQEELPARRCKVTECRAVQRRSARGPRASMRRVRNRDDPAQDSSCLRQQQSDNMRVSLGPASAQMPAMSSATRSTFSKSHGERNLASPACMRITVKLKIISALSHLLIC